MPTRLHMTAQRPGKGLTQSLWAGKRSFVFFPGKSEYAFDYLTQLLPSDQCHSDSKYPPTSGEFMFGGGAMLGGSAEAALFENIGNVDDERSELEVGAYLGGVLERYFSPWGKEGDSEDTSQPPSGSWGEGRMKALWTGIMGISADLKPWIGRVPTSISKRDEPRRAAGSSDEDNTHSHPRHLRLADPGEWIAAGFSGEGMAHAWLSGQALARMVLCIDGKESDFVQLPPSFLITEKRWKQASIEQLMEGIAG